MIENVSMIIDSAILERTCKDMIETILFCLSDATKGTIYRVGPMPRLQVVRVTSGEKQEGSGHIEWGLSEEDSDYDAPGKEWEHYRDRPWHVMEAMGWCIEKQKSWTADNPYEDVRSVRKQLRGEIEDFHHMEPVLVRKKDLYPGPIPDSEYPLDHAGNPIWKDNDYIVVAVIKIHFKPYKISRGDHSTKIIKRLSRTLGTELLSLYIRETLADAQKEIARQRLQGCNVMAHELRNTLMKLGFVFCAINAELEFLRGQWERELEKAFPELDNKRGILLRLNQLIQARLPLLNGKGGLSQLGEALLAEQQELSEVSPMPKVVKKWVDHRIRPKWHRLLLESQVWHENQDEIQELLGRLDKVIWMGTDEALALKMSHLPDDLRSQWPRLAYLEFSADHVPLLNEILHLLDHPALNIPHKLQTRKILVSLKALAEIIPEVEERANRIISSLKNGCTLEE